MFEGTEIVWWQWWLLIAITINTTINLIVFFKGRKLHIGRNNATFRAYCRTKIGRSLT